MVLAPVEHTLQLSQNSHHQKVPSTTGITLIGFVEQTSVKAVPYWIFDAYIYIYSHPFSCVKRADSAQYFLWSDELQIVRSALSFTRLQMRYVGGDRTDFWSSRLIICGPRVPCDTILLREVSTSLDVSSFYFTLKRVNACSRKTHSSVQHGPLCEVVHARGLRKSTCQRLLPFTPAQRTLHNWVP